MVMPSDMGAMAQQMPAAAAAMTPPEQEVVMGAMQASGGPEVQQMIASEAQDYGDPETAENYEEMMNMVRGRRAPFRACLAGRRARRHADARVSSGSCSAHRTAFYG